MSSSDQSVSPSKKYFLLGVLIYEHEVWSISCLANSQFRFLQTEEGPVRVFKDDVEAREFASKNNIQLERDFELIELEPLIEWVRYEKTAVDCKSFINAYNCTEDFSDFSVHSLPVTDDFGLAILRKLYRGSLTPDQLDDDDDAPFTGEWSEFEIMLIKKLMSDVVVFWMKQLKETFVPEYFFDE